MRLGFLSLLALALVPRAFADPEIFAIDPDIGSAGEKITIKGKGLETTQHVVFAVGRTVKSARFRVVSDRELEVIAPEYYRPQAAATVAVFTRSGATVAMPATAETIKTPVRGSIVRNPGDGFHHVLDGGILTRAGSVSLIEGGGVVESGGMAGMHFVRSGGTLVDYENPNGVLFHEPGARFGPNIPRSRPGLTLIGVPSVSVSPGVGPFVYQRTAHPDLEDVPAAPPQVQSIEPLAAAAGEIITLHGRGFARTTSVLSVELTGAPSPADFRIVSDTLLKVELPDQVRRPGPLYFIVISTEGLTVTVPRDRMLRAVRHPFPPAINQPFLWVTKGDIADKTGVDVAVFVEDGGLLTNSGGKVVFVKKGGRVADPGGSFLGLYYEPGAVVPERTRGRASSREQEVPVIVPSYLPHPFLLLPGPAFRR